MVFSQKIKANSYCFIVCSPTFAKFTKVTRLAFPVVSHATDAEIAIYEIHCLHNT